MKFLRACSDPSYKSWFDSARPARYTRHGRTKLNISFPTPKLYNTVQGQGLSLQLRDFASKIRSANISRQTQSMTIVPIAFDQFCSFLYMQRPEMRPSERNEAYNLPLHPTAEERRREATPPEALCPRKEAQILPSTRRKK